MTLSKKMDVAIAVAYGLLLMAAGVTIATLTQDVMVMLGGAALCGLGLVWLWLANKRMKRD